MSVIKECIAVIKKDISAIKQFFFNLFTVTNPIIEYPVIISTVLNLIMLTLICILETHLLGLNIEIPQGSIVDKPFILFLGYIEQLLGLLLMRLRNDVNLLTMKPDGPEPFSQSFCIVLSIVFTLSLSYVLLKTLKNLIVLL